MIRNVTCIQQIINTNNHILMWFRAIRYPCSDSDMLPRLINCRIIIIIKAQFAAVGCQHANWWWWHSSRHVCCRQTPYPQLLSMVHRHLSLLMLMSDHSTSWACTPRLRLWLAAHRNCISVYTPASMHAMHNFTCILLTINQCDFINAW